MRVAEKLYKLYQRKGESQRQTCRRIAKDLEINHKYFYHIMTDRVKPGLKLTAEMMKLERKLSGKVPPAYKPRLVISYDDRAQHQRHMRLGNSVRRSALDLYIALPPGEKHRANMFSGRTPILVMVDDDLLATRIGLLSNEERVRAIKDYLHSLQIMIRNLPEPNEQTEKPEK